MKNVVKSMKKPYVVVPSWNGASELRACLDSLRAQSLKPHVIIVDNGSADESVSIIEKDYTEMELIKHDVNHGYAGGVNPGFKRAIEDGADYVAPFNNDAVADKNWLKNLVNYLDQHDEVGIAACKLLSMDGSFLDSAGEFYSVWGLAYPRGRGETDVDAYDKQTELFAASGGASLYRVAMLKAIGLFDEDFFAYYEDVDLSFRAQLAGWKVRYVPSARVYHQIGATSGKIKGFTTYQAMKNLQLLYYKNVPRRYLWRIGWRLTLAQTFFLVRAFTRRQFWPALKGDLKGTWLVMTGGQKRRHIQRNLKVSEEYIWQMTVHDLPPNSDSLRKLRTTFWKITGQRRKLSR